jgi:hypothetical protein
MRTPLPQRGIEQFDQHDSFLFAVIGLASALSGLDAILGRRLPGDDGLPPPVGERDPVAAEDPVLHALLGVLALRRACGDHLSRLAPEGRPSGEDESPAPRTSPQYEGSLLR